MGNTNEHSISASRYGARTSPTQDRGPLGYTATAAKVLDYTPKTSREFSTPFKVEFDNPKLGKFKVSVAMALAGNTAKEGLAVADIDSKIKHGFGAGKNQLSMGASKKLTDNLSASFDFKAPDVAKLLSEGTKDGKISLVPTLGGGIEWKISSAELVSKIMSLFVFGQILERCLGPGSYSDMKVKLAVSTSEYPMSLEFAIPYKTIYSKFDTKVKVEIQPKPELIRRICSLLKIGKFGPSALTVFRRFIGSMLPKCPGVLSSIAKVAPRALGRLNLGLSLAMTLVDVAKLAVVVKDLVVINQEESRKLRATAKSVSENIVAIKKRLYAMEYANFLYPNTLRHDVAEYRKVYNAVKMIEWESKGYKRPPEDDDFSKQVRQAAVRSAEGKIHTKANSHPDLLEWYIDTHELFIKDKLKRANQEIEMLRPFAIRQASFDILRSFYVDLLYLDEIDNGKDLIDRMMK